MRKIIAILNSRALWRVANLAMLGAFAYFAWKIHTDYSDQAKLAVDKGKQVIIDVETGEITMRVAEAVPESETEGEDTEPYVEPIEESTDENTSGEETQTDETNDSDENNDADSSEDSAEDEATPQQDEAATPENEEIAEEIYEIHKSVISGEAKIAVIIRNLGLDAEATNTSLTMPENVTLSFSPYAKNVDKWAQDGSRKGHEILLDLPVETTGYPMSDPGSMAVMTNLGKAENSFRLKSALDAASNYKGVMIYDNESITHSFVTIIPVIDELKKHQAMLVYNTKVSNNFLRQEAKSIGLPVVPEYIVVDDVLTEKAIDEKIKEAEKSFLKDGESIVIVANPYPLTITRINSWLENFLSRGNISITPISRMAMN